MAQKFGGKFSRTPVRLVDSKGNPSTGKFRGRKTKKLNFRAKSLFLAPLPLMFTGIGELRAGEAMGMIAEFGALIILLLAAMLLREGLEAEDAYDERRVARPPELARKSIASALTGLGVFLAAYGGWQQGLLTSLAYGGVAALAHVASFGIDPREKKGLAGQDDFETERVALAIEKAEILLGEMMQAAARLRDRKLQGRIETLSVAVREVFRAIEDDPRDLSSSRKFLSVYLRGARDATVKFADLARHTTDPAAKASYEALLDDLETSFTDQHQKMLLDDRADLDIEIEVLRERLNQTGARTK